MRNHQSGRSGFTGLLSHSSAITFLSGFLALLVCLSAASVRAEELAVKALVDKNQAYVGEPITLQIQVEGDDAPAEPDLSVLSDFSVQPLGGQQNSSQSLTIINGKVNQVSTHGYIFNYRITPKRTGMLIIPALTAVTKGGNLTTRPIQISVIKPEETVDFKLRISLSNDKPYVGEAVTMTVTWYLAKQCADVEFNLPFIDDPRFDVMDPTDVPTDQNSLRIPVGNREVIAQKGSGSLEGRQYTTISFKQILIPLKAGNFTLPQATVLCKVLTGYHQDNNDPFSRFFGRSQRGVYQSVITPSNEPAINVRTLPSAGKTADFTGLIGEVSIVTLAEPTEVNVGDPITLKIMLTGPEYLKNAQIPVLQKYEDLQHNFKIPEDMAPGEITNFTKVFTQTIRARNDQVKQIPALTLSYFDSKSGTYKTARSQPIPLIVHPTRTVTAQDAEGNALVNNRSGRELKGSNQGIAFNYDGEDVLTTREFVPQQWSPTLWWWLLLSLPPVVCLLVWLFGRYASHRLHHSGRYRSRRAAAQFMKTIKPVEPRNRQEFCDRLNQAVKEYLGAKLTMPASTLTFVDVRGRLADAGVNAEILKGLAGILESCEAHKYAGGDTAGIDLVQLKTTTEKSILEIDRCLP